MRAGFIGTGSMGSILIEAFIKARALGASQITITNRTLSKAERLTEQYPGLVAVRTNEEVVRRSDLIFICVKPLQFKQVIDDIKQVVTAQQIIVSITSPILLPLLEEQLISKIAKVIPSITNLECSGATLCIYGKRISEADKIVLENLLNYISDPIRLDEDFTRVSSDLSSCGPAFICFFLQHFIDAAVTETGIPREEASQLASRMLLGTGKLITSGGFTPTSLQKRVSVPGGITAEGLQFMAGELKGMFNQLIRTTHAKYEHDLQEIEQLFYSPKIDE